MALTMRIDSYGITGEARLSSKTNAVACNIAMQNDVLFYIVELPIGVYEIPCRRRFLP
jgi:hypothetical protein